MFTEKNIKQVYAQKKKNSHNFRIFALQLALAAFTLKTEHKLHLTAQSALKLHLQMFQG